MRICSFDSCGRKINAKGLCQSHYLQHRAGKPLKPIRSRRSSSYTEDGLKICCICGEAKTPDAFPRDRSTYDGINPRCKACHNLERARYKSVNAEAVKSSTLKSAYGKSLQWYDEMLRQQGGGCAICGKTPEENGKALAVDHDHACCPGGKSCGGCVRQLLCSSCNRGLGYLNDDPELLRKAAEYIERHSEPNKEAA